MNGVNKNNKNVVLGGQIGQRLTMLGCAYALNFTSSRLTDISQLVLHNVDPIGKREQRVF